MPGLDGELEQWLEKVFLQSVDQDASDALQLLLKDQVDMSPKLRSGWSRFMMSLMSRTPEKIAWIRSLYEDEFVPLSSNLEAAYDQDHATEIPPPSAERKAADIAKARELGMGRLIQKTMDLPNVGQEFNNMIWGLLTPKKSALTFLTSDRPFYMSSGLQHADVFLTLPISPTKLFIAGKTTEVLNWLASLGAYDLTIATNRTVVQQAIKFVYGTNGYQRNLVEKHLRVTISPH